MTYNQIPIFPDADPRSDRFRCGGRESKFLAFLVGGWFTLLATALAQGPTDPNEGAQLTPGSGSGNYTFSWYARTENLYYLQWSTNLVDWHYFPYVLLKGPAPFTTLALPTGAAFVFGGFSQTLESFSCGAGATLTFTSNSSEPFSYRFQMAGPSLYVRAELGPITAPADADGDGIFDYQEVLSSLDPQSAADTDTDGLPDDWERFWFGNLASHNGTTNGDGDAFTDAQEFFLGLSPNAANNASTATMTYDSVGRLKTKGTLSFDYDAEGNLLNANP